MQARERREKPLPLQRVPFADKMSTMHDGHHQSWVNNWSATRKQATTVIDRYRYTMVVTLHFELLKMHFTLSNNSSICAYLKNVFFALIRFSTQISNCFYVENYLRIYSTFCWSSFQQLFPQTENRAAMLHQNCY